MLANLPIPSWHILAKIVRVIGKCEPIKRGTVDSDIFALVCTLILVGESEHGGVLCILRTADVAEVVAELVRDA